MNRTDVLDSAYRIGRFLVSDIYAFYQDTYKGVLGKVQVEALDCLSNYGAASIMDVAKRLNISKQHASKIVGKLEEMGLATKRRNPCDGRSWLYSLSEQGISFVESHVEKSNEHLLRRLDELDDENRELLARALSDAARAIEPLA